MRLSAQEDYPEWEKLDYLGFYGSQFSKIAVNDRNELFVSLPTGVFKSTDQGENWARLNMPDSIIYSETSMLLRNNVISLYGYIFDYNRNFFTNDWDNYLIISYDYGETWKVYHNHKYFADFEKGVRPEAIDQFGRIWGIGFGETLDEKGKLVNLYVLNIFDFESKTNINLIEVKSPMWFRKIIIEDSTVFAISEEQKMKAICIFRSTNLGQTWDTLHSDSEGNIYFELGKSSNPPSTVVYSQRKLYITLNRGYMVIDIDNKTYELTEISDHFIQPYRLFKRNNAEFYAFTRSNESNNVNLRRSRDTMKTWEDIDYNLQYTGCNDLAIDSTNNVYRLDNVVFRLKDGETNWTSYWSGLLNASGGYFQVNSKSEILRGNLYYKDGKWINLENIWTECRVQYPQNDLKIFPNDRIVQRRNTCGIVHTEYPFDKFDKFIAFDSIIVFHIYNWIEKNQNRHLVHGLVELDNNQRNFYYLESKDNFETWEILEDAYLPHNGSTSDGCFRFNKYDEFLYIGDSAKVHLSTDKGKSWKLVHDESLNPYFENKENSSYIYTTYNSTTGTGFALYDGYGLMLLTRDHGRTWTTHTNNPPFDPIYDFISSTFKYSTSTRYSEIITDLSTGYFYAPTWGGIYRSTDSLRSFHNMSKGLLEPSVITELQLGNDGKLYAMNYMGLWRTKDKVVSSVENTDEPILSRGNGLFIYPNPASEYIEINNENKALQPIVNNEEIKIFNTLGECVIELTDVQHLGDVGHLQRIDVSHLPRGVYYLRIGSRTQMFVKV